MKIKFKKFVLWTSIATVIGLAIYMNLSSYLFSSDEDAAKLDSTIPENEESKTFGDIVDISIKNVIVYPNRYDKKSLYIDIEIDNKNGDEFAQITLMNNGRLVASDKIKFSRDKQNYFQSFLLKDNIDFNKNFEVKLSSLRLENNISNNRYIFATDLREEKMNIAIISGALNYNTRGIIANLNNNYDHYYPNIDEQSPNFEKFWFKKYDIIFLDNFPEAPISDRWFNLFIKKIYSENSSLIMIKGDQQDFESLLKISPLFGLDFLSKNELRNISKITFFEKNNFRSVFINDESIYKDIISGNNELFEEAVNWVSKSEDINYTFFLGNKSYKINEPIFLYGFANRTDLNKQEFFIHLFKEDILFQEEKLYINPIADYYYNKVKISSPGFYKIEILNKEKILLQTINVNVLEEIAKL